MPVLFAYARWCGRIKGAVRADALEAGCGKIELAYASRRCCISCYIVRYLQPSNTTSIYTSSVHHRAKLALIYFLDGVDCNLFFLKKKSKFRVRKLWCIVAQMVKLSTS
jgi:hypothetical protein